jgi:3-oxoacyl-[acyl-carrier-protein] synthase II
MTARVVITGMGVLTANADSARAYTNALRDGRSGVRTMRRFDPGWPFRQAGEVDLAEADPTLDRVSQLAVSTAHQAVADALLPADGDWRRQAGVFAGTSRGPAIALETALRCGADAVLPALLAEIPFHSVARNVAGRLGLEGPRVTVTMACVSSSLAVGRATAAVRRGRVRVALAGGADALTNLSFSGFSVLRAMTKTVCRPFDRRRDGMVLGEGAGWLVLEEAEHARQRGARIYGEVCGWGTACDAYHPTSPHPEGRGLRQAMARALEDARLPVDAVDHVNLHGTGTAANDPAECRGVEALLGERARRVPVNSLKPMIGHTLGAAGVLELAGSVLGMYGGFLPPTLNHEEGDPACPLDVVKGASRETRVDTFISTKSAFGGANVAIVVRRAP